MIVLLAWAAAALIALLIVGLLGYELLGHLGRLRRAVRAAQADLLPMLRRLGTVDRPRIPTGRGRHRAGVPRP